MKVATPSSANTKVNQNNILESKSNAHHATAQPFQSTAVDSSHLEITSNACTTFGNHAVHTNRPRMECSTTADVSEFMIQSVFEYKRPNAKLLPLLKACSDQAQLAMTPPYLQVCEMNYVVCVRYSLLNLIAAHCRLAPLALLVFLKLHLFFDPSIGLSCSPIGL
jgi:hypothetical protein